MSNELVDKKKMEVVIKFGEELNQLAGKYQKYLPNNFATQMTMSKVEETKDWFSRGVRANTNTQVFTPIAMATNKIIT